MRKKEYIGMGKNIYISHLLSKPNIFGRERKKMTRILSNRTEAREAIPEPKKKKKTQDE